MASARRTAFSQGSGDGSSVGLSNTAATKPTRKDRFWPGSSPSAPPREGEVGGEDDAPDVAGIALVALKRVDAIAARTLQFVEPADAVDHQDKLVGPRDFIWLKPAASGCTALLREHRLYDCGNAGTGVRAACSSARQRLAMSAGSSPATTVAA